VPTSSNQPYKADAHRSPIPYKPDAHLTPTPYKADAHRSPTPYKPDAHLAPAPHESDAHLSPLQALLHAGGGTKLGTLRVTVHGAARLPTLGEEPGDLSFFAVVSADTSSVWSLRLHQRLDLRERC